MKNILLHHSFLAVVFLASSCSQSDSKTEQPIAAVSWTNDSHLTALYAPVQMSGGIEVGTVGIYSDYPAYNVVSAAGEGFTCVDDVSRAALFYLNETDISTNTAKQQKLLKMTEFVLQMQAANGYFYNFLNDNLTVNQTGVTSVAGPEWWSWRALWHLSEAYPFYQTRDAVLAGRIQASIQEFVANIKADFGSLPNNTIVSHGLTIPTWLPAGSGTDQAAIMMLGLANVYQQNGDAQVLAIIEKLADGILLMQKGAQNVFPYGAILSFDNSWHAYGCDQAYALLKVGNALNKPAWITAAKVEVDNFYPYLLNLKFLERFTVQQSGSTVSVMNQSAFNQISYGIRPMVWAAVELYKITNNDAYLTQASVLLTWYAGNNPANQKMYDKSTGVCYDGITSTSNVNRNSGAESTIEALWAFQLAEKYPAVMVEVKRY